MNGERKPERTFAAHVLPVLLILPHFGLFVHCFNRHLHVRSPIPLSFFLFRFSFLLVLTMQTLISFDENVWKCNEMEKKDHNLIH